MKYLPLDVKEQLINEPLTNQPEVKTKRPSRFSAEIVADLTTRSKERRKQVIGENEEYEHYQHREVNRGTPEG